MKANQWMNRKDSKEMGVREGVMDEYKMGPILTAGSIHSSGAKPREFSWL